MKDRVLSSTRSQKHKGSRRLTGYDELEVTLQGALSALENILKEKLDNYGIYYRMFSRIKSGYSIQKKLEAERYVLNPDKMIRDVFGIRIILYYQDDIEVCKHIFERVLTNIAWKQSESDANTFNATKNNGTFLLPGYIRSVVDPVIAGLRIAPTFEVQIRTVFFEGWHEAEHDMRYKEQQIWASMFRESRRLNSVLATLEMCDQYMVNLFDDVGHDFYKKFNWGQMIRYRYRLKTLHGDLDSELELMISPQLGKRIFKFNKIDLIEMVPEYGLSILNANVIVFLVNEYLKDTEFYCEEIKQRFEQLKRLRSKRIESQKTSEIVMLENEKAFDAKVSVDLSVQTIDEAFEKILAETYHGWLSKELSELFPDIFEQDVHVLNEQKQGISFYLDFNREHHTMTSQLSYIATDEPGKVWLVTVSTYPTGDGLVLHCKNELARAKQLGASVNRYNRPKVYVEIAKNVGICDVRKLTNTITRLTELSLEEFEALLQSPKRSFPVLLLTAPNEEVVADNYSCYGRLVDYTKNPKMPGQNNLMRKVGYVCHVFYAIGAESDKIAERLGENPSGNQHSARFFGAGFDFDKKKNYNYYSEKQILEKPKDLYALREKPPYFYQTVAGPDAMRHELIKQVYQHVLNYES